MNNTVTTIPLLARRVWVFGWLLQKRIDTQTLVTIDSSHSLTIIQNVTTYESALSEARLLVQRDNPDKQIISHTCMELTH